MIAGVRIDPLAAEVLAALCALRPPPAPLTPALAALLPADPPADAIARALARRKTPGAATGYATAEGAAPAARFLRRLGRRARTLHGAPVAVPDGDTLRRIGHRVPAVHRPAELTDDEALGAWAFVWAHADAGRRRDAAAALPAPLARRVGHAPAPPPARAARWCEG